MYKISKSIRYNFVIGEPNLDFVSLLVFVKIEICIKISSLVIRLWITVFARPIRQNANYPKSHPL